MLRIYILILSQAFFSIIEAYLVSKISFLGKIGISTTHTEYQLLRSGWKTFLLFFGIQLLIIFVLSYMQKKSPPKATHLTATALLVMAIFGLLITYNDFQHTFTHRLLRERFHLGFYLFWLGWISSCIFFLSTTVRKKPDENTPAWPEDKSGPQIL